MAAPPISAHCQGCLRSAGLSRPRQRGQRLLAGLGPPTRGRQTALEIAQVGAPPGTAGGSWAPGSAPRSRVGLMLPPSIHALGLMIPRQRFNYHCSINNSSNPQTVVVLHEVYMEVAGPAGRAVSSESTPDPWVGGDHWERGLGVGSCRMPASAEVCGAFRRCRPSQKEQSR